MLRRVTNRHSRCAYLLLQYGRAVRGEKATSIDKASDYPHGHPVDGKSGSDEPMRSPSIDRVDAPPGCATADFRGAGAIAGPFR